MVSSRIVALTVYAAMYQEFVFLVIGLHWFSASLWLLSPRNLVFEEQQKAGEETTGHKSSSLAHRFLPSLFIGWIFNFCYVNLHEVKLFHHLFPKTLPKFFLPPSQSHQIHPSIIGFHFSLHFLAFSISFIFPSSNSFLLTHFFFFNRKMQGTKWLPSTVPCSLKIHC